MEKIFLYDDGIGYVELLDVFGTEKDIVNAARVSFDRESKKINLTKKDSKLIRYLYEHEHTSPFEHVFVKFRIKVPLFVRSQHHRHRTWSFNELSRRYTSENLEFWTPKEFRRQATDNRQASTNENFNPAVVLYEHEHDTYVDYAANELWEKKINELEEFYEDLIRAGVAREMARGILPQAAYSHYIATVDLNNLIKFFKLRIHDGAQYEIRVMAEAMLELIRPYFSEVCSIIDEELNHDLHQ